MLARLQQRPEVLLAEVEQTGHIFRVQLSASISLQELFRRYEELREEDIPGDATWFSWRDITQLSLLEARLLASRWSARATSIQETHREQLREVLEEELTRVFLRVHEAGDAQPGWYKSAFLEVAERAAQRMESKDLQGELRGFVSSIA